MEANWSGAGRAVMRGPPREKLLTEAIAGEEEDRGAMERKPAGRQRTDCLLEGKGAWKSAAAREFIARGREIEGTREQENGQALYEDLRHLPTSLD